MPVVRHISTLRRSDAEARRLSARQVGKDTRVHEVRNQLAANQDQKRSAHRDGGQPEPPPPTAASSSHQAEQKGEPSDQQRETEQQDMRDERQNKQRCSAIHVQTPARRIGTRVGRLIWKSREPGKRQEPTGHGDDASRHNEHHAAASQTPRPHAAELSSSEGAMVR